MPQIINPPYASSIQAWWDVTDYTSLTLSSGKITTVNDQTAAGLHLTQATSGYRPTLEKRGTKYVASMPGNNMGFDAPGGLSINHRSCTIVLAFQFSYPQIMSDGATLAVPFTTSTGNNYLRFGYTQNGWQVMQNNAVTLSMTNDYMSSSPVLLQWACGATNTKLKVDNGAVTPTASPNAAASSGAIFGNYAGYFLGGENDFYGAIVYNRQLTDAEMENVRAWAANHWGIGVAKTALVVYDGDSNVAGGFSSGSNDVKSRMYSPAAQLARLRPDWIVHNFGVGGITTAQNITNMTAQARVVIANPPAGCQTVSVLANGNDQAGTQAAAVALYTTYLANMRASSPLCKRVICTQLGRVTSGYNAWVSQLNTLIRAGYTSYADALADNAAISLLDYTDTNYFSADGVHMDENGYALVAENVARTIESVLATATNLDQIYAQTIAIANNFQS